jgi:hypothetical protein
MRRGLVAAVATSGLQQVTEGKKKAAHKGTAELASGSDPLGSTCLVELVEFSLVAKLAAINPDRLGEF